MVCAPLHVGAGCAEARRYAMAVASECSVIGDGQERLKARRDVLPAPPKHRIYQHGPPHRE